MGIRLSDMGGLTLSQKQGKTPVEQAKLLEKLSKMEINQPILKAVKQRQEEKMEKARERAEEKPSKNNKDR